jgi:acyl-CoA synthetase (AMP-forming)/AMP-acid ligase II
MDIGTLVSRAATRYGDRVALECGTEQRTFAELGDRVNRLGHGLLALGLEPGDRVLDLQDNSITAVESDLAIRSAGLVRAALNARLHPTDWARITADSGARAIIVGERHADAARDVLDAVEHVIVVAAGADSPYESIIARATGGSLPVRAADTFCGLHYSSGTTGHPKGAQRTHRNWMASVINMTHDVLGGPTRAGDCYVHAGPITHTSGLFVLPFLVAGSRQLVLPRWDADAFLEAVTERGATHTALVPTMIARLLAHPGADRQALRGLRMLGYAGAPMPPEQMRQAHERLTPNLVQYYGLVEAIPPVTVLDADDHARGLADEPDLLGSAGRPALGVEIAVVDEDGRAVPVGEIGEVITRGDHVMAGYWNADGRTDLSKAVRDGWLHTGDLGRLGNDGRLWLVDRKGDMIISGGYNIYPREIEDVVAEVRGVREVAVLGVPDAEWGQRVVAFYTADDGTPVDEAMVMAHCRERLASYKKPKELRRLDAFPVSSTGKIAKKQLAAELSAPGTDRA